MTEAEIKLIIKYLICTYSRLCVQLFLYICMWLCAEYINDVQNAECKMNYCKYNEASFNAVT